MVSKHILIWRTRWTVWIDHLDFESMIYDPMHKPLHALQCTIAHLYIYIHYQWHNLLLFVQVLLSSCSTSYFLILGSVPGTHKVENMRDWKSPSAVFSSSRVILRLNQLNQTSTEFNNNKVTITIEIQEIIDETETN